MSLPVQLTVGLPMYRTKHIGWLALEALARQVDIDFSWELIVAEEQEELMLGEEAIRACESRLREAGCTRVEYIPVQSWISLSQKWLLLARHASATSEVFAFQAADAYCHPHRLRTSFDLTLGQYDWSQSKKMLMYSVKSGKVILLDRGVRASWGYHNCGDNMAVKTVLARKLPKADCRTGVDNWLYRRCQEIKGSKLNVIWDESTNWKAGFHTKGLNNISDYAGKFETVQAPFQETGIDLKDTIPAEILVRLGQLQALAAQWEVQPWSGRK